MKQAILLIFLLIATYAVQAQCSFDVDFSFEPQAPGNVYCPYDVVQLKATSGLTAYQWYYSYTGSMADGQEISGANSSEFLVDVGSWGFAYFYVLAVDDTGCEAFSDLKILDSWVFSGVAIAHDPQTDYCKGDSVLIENAFNGPAFFQWYKNFEPIPGATAPQLWVKESGTYTLSAAWQVCPDYWVSSGVGPTFNFTAPIEVEIQINGSTLTASSGQSFQWLLNGEPIAGATGNTYEAEANGMYIVQVVDLNGCTAVSEPINITILNTRDGNRTALQFGPNPFNEVLQIQSGGAGLRSLELYDVSGRRVAIQHVSKGTQSYAWQLSPRLPAGWYTCRIRFDDASLQILKLEKM